MESSRRTNATKTLFLALSLAAVGCYDIDHESSAPPPPSGAPRKVAQTAQAPTERFAFSTDIFLQDAPADPVEQQRQLDSRCKLWETYLELGQSEAQRRGDGGRGIVADSAKCTIVGVVEDTGRRDAEGRPARMVQGRLDIQVAIPAGRPIRQESRARFTSNNRYEAWLQCHKAAAQTRGEAFKCQDNGRQEDGSYASNLIVMHFDQQAANR